MINYLCKSVFELVDAEEDNYTLFGLDDIAELADAYYKGQMALSDKYGDLFVDILSK